VTNAICETGSNVYVLTIDRIWYKLQYLLLGKVGQNPHLLFVI